MSDVSDVSVGAAEGCDLLTLKIKRSQPSAAPEVSQVSRVSRVSRASWSMRQAIQRLAAAFEPANQIIRQHLRAFGQPTLVRVHQIHRHPARLKVAQQPAQPAVSEFCLQQIRRQPCDTGAGQCGFLQQVVMVAGERPRHPHPQQFVLLVIQPFLATTVVAVEQAAVFGQLLRGQRLAELF